MRGVERRTPLTGRTQTACGTTIPLQHGLPGTVEVEVERVSPATLVLREVGKHLGVPPQNVTATGRQDGTS